MSAANQHGPKHRLGAVSFLNAKPLVEGLDATHGVELIYDVPARLPDLLDAGQVDAALAPVIDLARRPGRWRIVSDACIGCDGETRTVRVFSRVPPEEITHLDVDGDSHTSVALAAVIWHEMYATRLQISPLQPAEPLTAPARQAVLLIGDKVVTQRPAGFEHEIDLGTAWKTLAGLPFVFAAWMVPAGADSAGLGGVLTEARDRGVRRAATIARQWAPAMGWPVADAVSYLTEHLHFKMTPPYRRGLELFFKLAGKWGIVPRPVQPAFA